MSLSRTTPVLGSRRGAAAAIAAAVLCACGGSSSGPTLGSWTATGPLGTARFRHTATVLPSGKVLVAGGGIDMTWVGATAKAEVWDPGAGTWTDEETMPGLGRIGHQAVLTSKGVLVVGGGSSASSSTDPTMDKTAVLYDPAGGSGHKWATTGQMNTARAFFTATVLPSGKVLVTGGVASGAGAMPATATAEIWDPDAGTWSEAEPMATARCAHRAVLLASGKVLVTGGAPTYAPPALASAEIYDPDTDHWSSADPMPFATLNHAAVRLQSGAVLVAGGLVGRRAALFDPVGGGWTEVAAPSHSHDEAAAVLLPSGKVLVPAGSVLAQPGQDVSEVYDPATDGWTRTGRMGGDQGVGAALVLLEDGGALLVGGHPGGSLVTHGAEIFTE